MSLMKRYARKQAKANKRRRLKAQQRLRQQRADAQRYIEAIHQALEDLDFPNTLVAEIEGRLQAQQALLGKIVGIMFPTLFGARHPHELHVMCNFLIDDEPLKLQGLSTQFTIEIHTHCMRQDFPSASTRQVPQVPRSNFLNVKLLAQLPNHGFN